MEIPQALVTHLNDNGKSADWDTINRCGIGYFSTGPDDPFADLCTEHDTAFLHGGPPEKLWMANKNFIVGMWKRVLHIDPSDAPRATLYTLAVTLLAEFWWRNYDRTVLGEGPKPAAPVDTGPRLGDES